MVCETVVVQGTEQPNPVKPEVIDTSGDISQLTATFIYTVNNVNDFTVQATVQETLTNTTTGETLMDETFTVTIGPNDEDPETTVFDLEEQPSQEINLQMCADVIDFSQQ
jgi:hypothetical protein